MHLYINTDVKTCKEIKRAEGGIGGGERKKSKRARRRLELMDHSAGVVQRLLIALSLSDCPDLMTLMQCCCCCLFLIIIIIIKIRHFRPQFIEEKRRIKKMISSQLVCGNIEQLNREREIDTRLSGQLL